MGPGASGGRSVNPCSRSFTAAQLSRIATVYLSWAGRADWLNGAPRPCLAHADTPSSRPPGHLTQHRPPSTFTSCTSPSLPSPSRRNDAPSPACLHPRSYCLAHPKRPAETRAQSARTPEQRLALPCPTVPQPHTISLSRCFTLTLRRLAHARFAGSIHSTDLRSLRSQSHSSHHSPSPSSPWNSSSVSDFGSARLHFHKRLLVLHFASPPPVTRH